VLDFGFQQSFDSIGKKDLTVRGDPKRSEPRVAINPPAAWLGARNAILWGKGKQYHVGNFCGPLSIKSVVRGSARWSTSEAERLVDETCYLVLNSKQNYSITIDSLATVETFCLFFRYGLVEDVSRVTQSGPTTLLDNPVPEASHALESAARADNSASSSGTSVEFFETLHAHDAVVSPLIQQIYARLKNDTASDSWLEDQFLGVAGALCKLRREADKNAELIPAKKYSSRMELYRRLLRGKDYMDSFSGTPIHLGEVAENACLSPYHFHRLFREVFRETPNQYLQRKRLTNARRLLERGEQSVTDVCLEVGFESVTSFSGLFRRNFGCSPREYRLRKSVSR
jgi:AraC family transcriptional regulator